MALKIKVFSTKHQSSCSLVVSPIPFQQNIAQAQDVLIQWSRGDHRAPWLRATKFLINLKGGLCFIANSQHFTQVPQCLLATKLETSSIPTVFQQKSISIQQTFIILCLRRIQQTAAYTNHHAQDMIICYRPRRLLILHPHNLATGEFLMRIFSLQVMGFLPSKPDWFSSCIKKELPTATSTVVFPLLGCVLLFLWLLA